MDAKNIFELAKSEVTKEQPKTEKEENRYMFCLQCLNDLSAKCGNDFSQQFLFDTYEVVCQHIFEQVADVINKKLKIALNFASIYGEAENKDLIHDLTKAINALEKEYNEHYKYLYDLLKKLYDSLSAKSPKEIIKALEKKGYIACCIEKIRVIYSPVGIVNIADDELSKGNDIIVNETFYDWSPQKGNICLGAVIQDGKLKNDIVGDIESNYGVIKKRAGLAIMSDNTLKFDISNGDNSLTGIKKQFDEKGRKVKDYISGGALLIKDGCKISGRSLASIQGFKHKTIVFHENGKRIKKTINVTNGFESDQIHSTYHIILAEHSGNSYIIAPRLTEKDLKDYNKRVKEAEEKSKKKSIIVKLDKGDNSKSAETIQAELYSEGFSNALKLDGGSAFFWKSNSYNHIGGICNNKSGLAIKVRKVQ